MIQAQSLHKRFGKKVAVADVSFQVAKGETLILLGPSGCGKTTTLRMLNRLIEPDKGYISIQGKDVRQQDPVLLRRGIGYVIQHTGLFPHYTIAENIALVPRLLKWEAPRIRKDILSLLEKLQLPGEALLQRYPHELSGGQRQRIGLARALISQPPLILMDEPFGALDPITRQRIRSELMSLEEFKNKTVIMVTHDVGEAVMMGDRICLMEGGKIRQIGRPADLLLRPVDDFVASFFASRRQELFTLMLRLSDLAPWLSEQALAQAQSFSVSGTLTLAEALNYCLDQNLQLRIDSSAGTYFADHLLLQTAFSHWLQVAHSS